MEGEEEKHGHEEESESKSNKCLKVVQHHKSDLTHTNIK